MVQRQRLLANAGLEDAQLLTAAEARRLEPALELGSEGSALLVPSDVQVGVELGDGWAWGWPVRELVPLRQSCPDFT